MKIKMLSPKSLTPYNKNPRDNAKAIEAVAQSIQDFGFNQPIVVDFKTMATTKASCVICRKTSSELKVSS